MKRLQLTIGLLIIGSFLLLHPSGQVYAQQVEVPTDCPPGPQGQCESDEGYKLNDGKKLRFDHDYGDGNAYCDVYTNTTGKIFFMPTRTLEEYELFRDNVESGIVPNISVVACFCGDTFCEQLSERESCSEIPGDDSMELSSVTNLPKCFSDCFDCPITCGDGNCTQGIEFCVHEDEAVWPTCNDPECNICETDCYTCQVAGECDITVQNGCLHGTPDDDAVPDTPDTFLWNCTGEPGDDPDIDGEQSIPGSTSEDCSFPKPDGNIVVSPPSFMDFGGRDVGGGPYVLPVLISNTGSASLNDINVRPGLGMDPAFSIVGAGSISTITGGQLGQFSNLV